MAIPVTQEPKYDSDQDGIFNRQSGKHIPHDEPVFIVRARDKHAIHMLQFYANVVKDPHHKFVVEARIEQFSQFMLNKRDRMKWPDTDPSINLGPSTRDSDVKA